MCYSILTYLDLKIITLLIVYSNNTLVPTKKKRKILREKMYV